VALNGTPTSTASAPRPAEASGPAAAIDSNCRTMISGPFVSARPSASAARTWAETRPRWSACRMTPVAESATNRDWPWEIVHVSGLEDCENSPSRHHRRLEREVVGGRPSRAEPTAS
jgi:hypothetical protein